MNTIKGVEVCTTKNVQGLGPPSPKSKYNKLRKRIGWTHSSFLQRKRC